MAETISVRNIILCPRGEGVISVGDIRRLDDALKATQEDKAVFIPARDLSRPHWRRIEPPFDIDVSYMLLVAVGYPIDIRLVYLLLSAAWGKSRRGVIYYTNRLLTSLAHTRRLRWSYIRRFLQLLHGRYYCQPLCPTTFGRLWTDRIYEGGPIIIELCIRPKPLNLYDIRGVREDFMVSRTDSTNWVEIRMNRGGNGGNDMVRTYRIS
ncbi:hypothetical protein F4678DRAFT_413850 [Xylaria arbuscula]|nr:hypothetical protein F4678DRAFT_413850 [Xylaria arbuscula]